MDYDKQILEQLLSEESRMDYRRSVGTYDGSYLTPELKDAKNKFEAKLDKQHTNMLNTLGTPNTKPKADSTPPDINAQRASSAQINKMERDMAHTGITQSNATIAPSKPIKIKQPNLEYPKPINVNTDQYKNSVLYINKDNKSTLPPKQTFPWEKPQTSAQNNSTQSSKPTITQMSTQANNKQANTQTSTQHNAQNNTQTSNAQTSTQTNNTQTHSAQVNKQQSTQNNTQTSTQTNNAQANTQATNAQTSTQANTQASTQATAQAKKSGNVIDHMKQIVKDHPKATIAVGAGSAALASAYAVYRMLKKKKAQALQRHADVEQLNKELARARARLNRLKQQQS